ncbi:MAG: HAD-IB family phosphatase [Thermoplasmatota archaeon]
MDHRKPLVVFDMDGVLIHERSSWRLVHEKLGTSNEDSFAAYMKGEIDDLEFMRRDIDLWMRKRVTRSSEIEIILEKATLMDGFMGCMDQLRDWGATLAIVSGGLDILAHRLGKKGGFSHVSANGLATDPDGNLTGEGILRVPLMDKGSVLRSIISENDGLGPVVVVGDSIVDISMFELSDLSIAFRPEVLKVSEAADNVISTPDLGLLPGLIGKFLGR